MSRTADERRRIDGAQEGANRPAAVEPSISNGSGVENAVTERRGDYTLREHGADKERPARPQPNKPRPCTDVGNAFAQFMREAGNCAIVLLLGWQRHSVPPFAHK